MEGSGKTIESVLRGSLRRLLGLLARASDGYSSLRARAQIARKKAHELY